MISLSQFCKDRNLPKGSVHRYLTQELNFDVSQGLTGDAILAAEKKFPPKNAIEALAIVPKTVDVSTLCSGSEMRAFDDPLAQVEDAISFADGVLEAMEVDVTYRISQLEQTQRANQKLLRKLETVKARQLAYESEARLLSVVQNSEADKLQRGMQEISELGKGQ